MMKRLCYLLASLLLWSGVSAQSVPNGGITQGQVWTVPQWITAWQSKQDIIPQTAAEIAAGVTPTNYGYPEGYALRYGSADTTCGTDDTTTLQNAINVAQIDNVPVVLPSNACYYITAALQFKQGKSATDTQSYSVNVIGNGATIEPAANLIAFQINPRCLLADKATGRGVAPIYITDVVFDGTKAGATGTRALLIGTAGYVTDSFPWSVVRNVTLQNWGAAITNAVLIYEARHIRFERLVLRANASLVVQATTASSFAGDLVFDNSDFSGSGSQPPITITANNGAQTRGIKFSNGDIYGGGSLLHSTGTGGSQVGDIWFTNEQFDVAAGSDVFLTLYTDTSAALLFDVHISHSYFVSGTQAIYIHTANSGVTSGIDISGNWFNTLNVSGLSGDKTVVLGLNANGIVVNNNQFDTITGGSSTSYVEMDGTTDFIVVNNQATNGTSVANGIVTANACNNYSIYGNVVAASSALSDGCTGSPTKQTGNNLAVTQ